MFDDLKGLEHYLRQVHAPFGALTDAQWGHMAVHGARQVEGGWTLGYDPCIADAFADIVENADMWGIWDLISCPTLVLRGEASDLLLPETAETENILNAETLDLLPNGAFIINPGRGPLIDDDALLGALESGKVAHATLDVLRVEPLPLGHPYWAHPNVTVTPHIASATWPETSSLTIAENIRRGEAGEPYLYTVDRSAGY